ncbi:ABC transporter permease [Alphaproteobacteria bacterium LSUCC0719]
MVATFLSYWSGRPARHIDGWSVSAIVICLFILGPILALWMMAFGDSQGLWRHLVSTVLPRYVLNTVLLMFGVGVLTILFGVSTAWVITRYSFVGKRVFEWLLLLPAAIPAYIIAYTYTDFLEYAGPVQSLLRDMFGWQRPMDYWFPDIRSLGGAVLVMSTVLYPYIYMVTRIAFRLTPASLFEIALVHDRSQFWSVGLPLARPAITAGLALVLMEVVSDFGTVEYFAVETITLGIFNVWLGMNNIVAAAQISLFGFVFILSLLALELYARSRQRFAGNGKSATELQPLRPGVKGQIACQAVCALPLCLGFVIPVGVLLKFVLGNPITDQFGQVVDTVGATMLMAGAAAVLIVVVSTLLVLAATYRGGVMVRRLTVAASSGYAIPGTMLAIGVLVFAGVVDRTYAGLVGDPRATLLLGGAGILLTAYLVRFQAVGYGALMSGIRRLPDNMMNASRVLGNGFGSSLKRVILPLLRGSMLAGGLLCFVDIMKELPITLLLRPFDFETLATYTYQFAKDEMLEAAALPALMIVVAGLVPVILMNNMLRRAG